MQERERERERETDRQREEGGFARKKETKTDRQKDRQRDRLTERETDRQTDRHRQTAGRRRLTEEAGEADGGQQRVVADEAGPVAQHSPAQRAEHVHALYLLLRERHAVKDRQVVHHYWPTQQQRLALVVLRVEVSDQSVTRNPHRV